MDKFGWMGRLALPEWGQRAVCALPSKPEPISSCAEEFRWRALTYKDCLLDRFSSSQPLLRASEIYQRQDQPTSCPRWLVTATVRCLRLLQPRIRHHWRRCLLQQSLPTLHYWISDADRLDKIPSMLQAQATIFAAITVAIQVRSLSALLS